MRLFQLFVVLAVCVGSGCYQPAMCFLGSPTPERPLYGLIRTIDDNPDPCHSDLTPSVHKLVELGDSAIPSMLNLMLLDGSGNEITRLHAQTALFYIVANKNGFESGRGWSDPQGLERVKVLWKSLGDLDYKAPLVERDRAVKLWREWFVQNKK